MLADVKLLLIDTCGDEGLVALSEGDRILAEERLAAREASCGLMNAVGAMLAKAGWSLSGLNAIVVVAGPGSFTGVRVGMSAAKGIVEATGLRLISISRLAVLAQPGGGRAFAALNAGRGEFYLRTLSGQELLVSKDELRAQTAHGRVFVAEPKVFDVLSDLPVEKIDLSLTLALPIALQVVAEKPVDAAFADANYVRREQDIYAKTSKAGKSA